MSQFVVGLTGGIGSGKSTVEGYFTNLGVSSVDADVVAREVVSIGSPALHKIHLHFGNDVLLNDGSLNRSCLRELIFNNPLEKNWLNQLLHPLIRQQLLTQLTLCQGDYAILTAPLLLENGLEKYCDQVLVVDVPEALQIERTQLRDGVSEQQIKSILASQLTREERRGRADQIIDNTQPLSSIELRVGRLNELYRQLAKEKLAKL